MSRILLSAYACEPGKGSEPAVGWMWATSLAALQHEVWVITRAANRSAIEQEPHRATNRMHFVYCDLPLRARRWKRFPGAIYLYYFVWQWLAFHLARRMNRAQHFDCVHHVTFVSLRGPSFMGWLGIPFYLGPVSGGECVPWSLRRSMTLRAQAFELARDCANMIARYDPLLRSAYRRARRIYVASNDSLVLVPRRYRYKCEVRLAVGLTRQQLGLTRRCVANGNATLRCLYVGRLLEWKGLKIALLAMQRLQEQGMRAHLTLIGDGPARAAMQRLASQLGIADVVSWHPWLAHEEVLRQFHHHNIFLFPSLRDSGGMAVLEALAHGLPVVCTDLGGPAHIVTEHCGRVVATNGRTSQTIASDIAGHLREFAMNRGLRQSLSIQARRRAWDFEFSHVVEAVYGACSAEHKETVPA